MKHDNEEGEMERYDSVRKMCVRHGVCVHLPVAHTAVPTTWVKNPQTPSFHSDLDFSHQDVVHQIAFHKST